LSSAGYSVLAAAAILTTVRLGEADGGQMPGPAQEQAPAPRALLGPVQPLPVPATPPVPATSDTPLPINLPTALQLAGVRPIEIGLASERIRVAAAQLERAQVLWLPTIYMGVDYYRHDGQIQDTSGNIFGASKQAFMVGAAPFAVFAVSDAILAPLSERQAVRAQQAALQTARNDSLLAVAEAYFNVQQARGELAGAMDAARRLAEVVRRTEKLAAGGEGILADVDVVRARTENAHRDQALDTAREHWSLASADLLRLLRLDPAVIVEPLEAPHLRITLIAPDKPVDDLVALGLTSRPELATQQALVQATLARLRQENLRPLLPSVLLRGASTNPAGTLAGGYFGAGRNDDLGSFGARGDFDVQVLWELQNLGFGNRALGNQRRAENRLAVLALFRLQDQVAAEVAQAYAQAQSAANRLGKAENGLADAVESANKHLEGLGQTKMAGGRAIVLVIRPQEVIAAIQALVQAYNDYYGAVADHNRAQFRLYRALGQPAQALTEQGADSPGIPLGSHPDRPIPEPSLPAAAPGQMP
jgi:outer membrane protein TolC